MDWKQQPGQSREEFQASIQQAYKEVLDLPEKKKDYYVAQLNEWYVKKMHDHTSEERVEGYSETCLVKLCSKFSDRASLMYDTHGLSFFGWVVDPVTAKAVQWGGDELFEGMRNANASALKVQSVDYGTMIHTQYMRLQQDNLLPPEKQKFIDRYSDQKSWLCTAFKDILVLLLCEVHPESNLQEFHWGASFADMCAKWKVCLVGWLVHLKVPGAPGDAGLTAMWQIPINDLKVLVKCQLEAWKKGVSGEGNSVPLFEDDEGEGKGEGKGSDSDDEDDEDEGGELVRFIPWDEEQMALSIRDQAHIPIVRAALKEGEEIGKPLCLVHQSKKYQLRLNNAPIVNDDNDNDLGTGAARRGRKTGKDRKEREAIDEATRSIAGKSRKHNKARTERKSSEEGGAVAGKIKKSDKPRKERESNEEEGTVAGKSKKSNKARKESENGRSRKDCLGKRPKSKALPRKESLPDKHPPACGSNTGNGSNDDNSDRLPSPPPPLSDEEDAARPQKQSKKAAAQRIQETSGHIPLTHHAKTLIPASSTLLQTMRGSKDKDSAPPHVHERSSRPAEKITKSSRDVPPMKLLKKSNVKETAKTLQSVKLARTTANEDEEEEADVPVAPKVRTHAPDSSDDESDTGRPRKMRRLERRSDSDKVEVDEVNKVKPSSQKCKCRVKIAEEKDSEIMKGKSQLQRLIASLPSRRK
ncbi:hypothetical protein GYMLUDRAFT_240628 [Collybiopsis luxurians FD-317 M1]|nr:hypothetical protein GYMLUDRAFT_240628 [Collybiopsis luxurians FD-317 M1]